MNLKWYLQLFSHVLAVCPAIADGRAAQHRYTQQSLGKELKQSPIIPYLLKSVSTLASRGTAAMGPSGAGSYGSAVVHFVALHSGTSQVDRISLRGAWESSLAQRCWWTQFELLFLDWWKVKMMLWNGMQNHILCHLKNNE